MSSATEAATNLVDAKFNPAVADVVTRNRELCLSYLRGNTELSERRAFLTKAAKDNFGNGLMTLNEEQLAALVERFPVFHPDSTEEYNYFAMLRAQVVPWLKEHGLLRNACVLLDIGFTLDTE